MTGVEFLAWEREQPERHIFYRGAIFSMAGGTPRHARLGMRIGALLDRQLGRGPCNAFSSDLRLSLGNDHIVYADVAVVCGQHQFRPGTKDTVTNPTVVVEVISKSNEAYDRGDKFGAYVATPSIKHIVLVAQRAARVDVYTRGEDGNFSFRMARAGETFALTAIDASISVDELYEGAFAIPGDDEEPPPPESLPDAG